MRLHLIVEGQKEETFVRDVLCGHLGAYDVVADARLIEFSRSHGRIFRGGVRAYEPIRRDITHWLREDRSSDVRFSTMLDFYGLPRDFPGYESAAMQSDPLQRAQIVESAFLEDIGDYRFIPYIQIYEFEALLFADISQFDWEFTESDHIPAIAKLAQISAAFESPEHINDGPATAPSKRIIAEIPEYEGRKPSAGPLIAEKIGIDTLRHKCLHFGEWLDRLETLSKTYIS